MYWLLLLLTFHSVAAEQHIKNYQALIERSGQNYAADVSFHEHEQYWTFLNEPYSLEINSQRIVLRDRVDFSEKKINWHEIDEDFKWLSLFPRLQQSLASMPEHSHILEHRFDYPEGSWLIHQKNQSHSYIARWLPRHEQQIDLILMLKEI